MRAGRVTSVRPSEAKASSTFPAVRVSPIAQLRMGKDIPPESGEALCLCVDGGARLAAGASVIVFIVRSRFPCFKILRNERVVVEMRVHLIHAAYLLLLSLAEGLVQVQAPRAAIRP